MRAARIIYFLIIVGAVVFFILYPLWFSWYLIVLVLLIPAFDLCLSLPGMLMRSVSLSIPQMLEMESECDLIITTHVKKTFFPAGHVRVRLRVDGPDNSSYLKIICESADLSKYEVAADTSHSGIIRYEVSRLKTTSLLKLFAAPGRTGRGVSALVLPKPVKPLKLVSLPQSDTRRKPIAGGGFSEEHDMRPYHPGDPMNSVHWKLSAKHDDLIVREPLMLPEQSRLVRCAAWTNPEERDIILGRLRWVSDYLIRNELRHYVKLEGSRHMREICEPGDLFAFLLSALDHTATVQTPTILPSRFSWIFPVDASEEST